jgi:hypothetical protein
MSKSTVGRLLKEAVIRPHKSRYWLNPNIEDEEVFKEEVKRYAIPTIWHLHWLRKMFSRCRLMKKQGYRR